MISQRVYIGNLKKMEPNLVNSLQNKTPFNKCFQSLEQIILSHFLGNSCAQITSLSSVCSNICSSADQRKQQSSASLAFVGGIHQWPVDPLTKGQKPGKCFHLMTSSWTQNHLVPTWCSLHWLCRTNCMWCNGSWYFKCNWSYSISAKQASVSRFIVFRCCQQIFAYILQGSVTAQSYDHPGAGKTILKGKIK